MNRRKTKRWIYETEEQRMQRLRKEKAIASRNRIKRMGYGRVGTPHSVIDLTKVNPRVNSHRHNSEYDIPLPKQLHIKPKIRPQRPVYKPLPSVTHLQKPPITLSPRAIQRKHDIRQLQNMVSAFERDIESKLNTINVEALARKLQSAARVRR